MGEVCTLSHLPSSPGVQGLKAQESLPLTRLVKMGESSKKYWLKSAHSKATAAIFGLPCLGHRLSPDSSGALPGSVCSLKHHRKPCAHAKSEDLWLYQDAAQNTTHNDSLLPRCSPLAASASSVGPVCSTGRGFRPCSSQQSLATTLGDEKSAGGVV